ncbi:MAG TPA: histone deacetylase family protein [Alphaproteobacteria bacterium]|nr:histone deacetylase family protein [Alphaproteobacteria bacterium]
MTALYTHPSCLEHDNGAGHPESPERLRAILAELKKPDYAALAWREAPPASIEQIARVHERAYVEDVLRRVPKEGRVALDNETVLSPASGEAALRAAGAVCAAVDEVIAGEVKNAFCAVRPPGHHAERAEAMGFCIFNNIAIGAAQALAAHGLRRVAILDFDVHHGNGTEEWAKGRRDVLFISSHQYPLYPGSGSARDTGPFGNIVNIPLVPGADGAGFRAAMHDVALPRIDEFAPELILISAGFDAHRLDPLAQLELEAADFGWITGELSKLAARYAKGRVVATLEGGYDCEALAESAGAHVRALMAA